jgi:hypothetical protein
LSKKADTAIDQYIFLKEEGGFMDGWMDGWYGSMEIIDCKI